MIALLRQSKLRRFFIAHAQSQLGTGAGYVALVLIAYQRLHAGWGVSLVLLADFLPGILFSSYFGVLADLHSRRRLAIAAELLRAGAFAALAFTSSFGATVGFALLAGTGTALFRPAVYAALPSLVSAQERSPATALYGALQSFGLMLGPALCGLMLLLGPLAWVLLANSATFVLSALLLAGVPLRSSAEAGEASDDQPISAWEAATQGGRYVARERGIGALLLIGGACVLCSAVINVVEPVLAAGPLHAGSSGFSVLVAVYGIGMVAGGIYTSRLGMSLATLRAHFLAGIAVSAIAMFGCATAGSFAFAIAPFALGGFANAVIIGPELRLVQELVSERMLGRVRGLQDSLESACFVAAFIVAGALLSIVGPRSVYALSGLLLLGSATAGWLFLRLPERNTTVSDVRVAERLPSPEPA